MKLYGIRIFANDMDEARAFCAGTAGLAVKWDYGSAVGYDVGADLIVETFRPEDDEALLRRPGGFADVSLQVADMAGTFRDLSAKGVRFVGPPEKMPWGGMVAHFFDPPDNVLTLLE